MALAAGKSGSDVEQLGDEGRLGPHVASANPLYLPLPHHRYHLVACQGSSRRPEAAEAEPRSDQAFHAPVVLFHYVIEVLDLAQPRASPQLTVLLHLRHHAWVGRVLVHCDGAWVHCVRLPQRLAEEALRGRRVPLGREQEVDRLAAAVDRAIEVGPAALHLHIRLVDPPRAVARTQVWPDPLLQLWRISLDPSEDRGVVDPDAAVGEHQLEIAV